MSNDDSFVVGDTDIADEPDTGNWEWSCVRTWRSGVACCFARTRTWMERELDDSGNQDEDS